MKLCACLNPATGQSQHATVLAGVVSVAMPGAVPTVGIPAQRVLTGGTLICDVKLMDSN